MNIVIDGRTVAFALGQTVLQAALSAGIYIPHLCSHPDLTPQGGCKLCVVEIEGRSGPVCACETPAEEGMRVTTQSPDLTHRRGVAMELMLAPHPHDCTTCKRYLKCELQSMMQYLGSVHSRLRTVHRKSNTINTHNPIIVREMERCIQCGRCVRACQDVRGIGVIDYKKLGSETYIGTAGDLPLADVDCRFCSACVEVCPTGALQDQEGLFRADLPREQALIPCQAECPAHIDIPAYLRLIHEGRYSDAVGVIREKVPFPHALGYVCNNRCEAACKREKLNSPLSIRNLKRFAAEHDLEQSWRGKGFQRPRTGRRVAVIGAGACGLTAAYYLNKCGHDITVFEKQPIPGGQMTCGMPEYRIPSKDVLAEISIITQSGVTVQCGQEISSASALRQDYDAVLVAVGACKGKKLALPGADLPRVYTALEMLQASRFGQPLELGETVTVIGGGNVAFDAARTAIRLGKRVNMVCLEKDASQAGRDEYEEGLAEGIHLYDCHSNEEILGSADGVTGLRVHRISGFYFDPDTHALVEEPVPDSSYILPTDSIVFAAGQETGLTERFGLQLNRFGYPVDPATGKSGYHTSVEGIFAAGDAITGTRFLIDAIAGGREAACLIDQYLGGSGDIEETLVERRHDPKLGKVPGFAAEPRQEMALRLAETRRQSFAPVSDGLSEEQATYEAGRCLQCDLRCDLHPVKMWMEYTGK